MKSTIGSGGGLSCCRPRDGSVGLDSVDSAYCPIEEQKMTFGEFLKQAFEWLYQFWPVRIIHDWEQGVRCRFGNATSLLTSQNGLGDTGLHVFWPLVGEINLYETNIEVSETELQTHTTGDGVAVTISLGIKYRIFDLKRMYQSIHDPVETLGNELCSAVGKCEIVSLSLINLTKARPIRLIVDRPKLLDRFE